MLRRALVVATNSARFIINRSNVASQMLPRVKGALPTPSTVGSVASRLFVRTPPGLLSSSYRQPFASAAIIRRIQGSLLSGSRTAYSALDYSRLGYCRPDDWGCNTVFKRDLSTLVQNQLSRFFPSNEEGSTNPWSENKQVRNLRDLQLGRKIGKGCNSVVYLCKMRDIPQQDLHDRYLTPNHIPSDESSDLKDWPMIVKVNYTFEGQKYPHDPDILPLKLRLNHPGIVLQYTSFQDRMFNTPEFCLEKTQHILMKRYSSNLADLLKSEESITEEESCSIIIQLLESDIYLKNNRIAHRDIKTDNIFIDKGADGSIYACLGDFGSALDKLELDDINSRDGNSALMAPEIAVGTGPFDYNKADVWALGTLIYQLFGQENPFYEPLNLDSRTYKVSDLPSLELAPPLIRSLVVGMLQPDPADRLSSRQCADILHFHSLDQGIAFPKSQGGSSIEMVKDWIFACVTRDVFSKSHMAKLRSLFYSRCWDYGELVKLNAYDSCYC